MVTCTSEYTSKKEGGISKSSSAAFASQKILNYPQMGIGALFIPLPENVIQAIKNATLQHLGEEQGRRSSDVGKYRRWSSARIKKKKPKPTL